jgi:hypothetical protein
VLTDDDKLWITGRLEKVAERIQKVEMAFADLLERVERTLLSESHERRSLVELRERSRAAIFLMLHTEIKYPYHKPKNLKFFFCYLIFLTIRTLKFPLALPSRESLTVPISIPPNLRCKQDDQDNHLVLLMRRDLSSNIFDGNW